MGVTAMKVLASIAISSCLAVCAFALQHGASGRGGGVSVNRPPAGNRHGTPVRVRDGARFRSRGLGYGVGYGYGLGYSGLYDEPYWSAGGNYAPEGGPSVVMPYPPPQPEPAIPVHPVIHEYNRPEDYGTGSHAEEALPAESPVLYLIATRDKNIRAASTYWIDGGTLYYLDADHREMTVPV